MLATLPDEHVTTKLYQALLFLGVPILYCLFLAWWEKYLEAVRPFRYSRVPLEEIPNHFTELYRRGYDGSEMIVMDRRTGHAVRLKKEFLGEATILLRLIAAPRKRRRLPGTHQSRKRKLQDICEQEGAEYTEVRWTSASNPCGLIAECKNEVELASRVGRRILLDFFGVPAESTFCVWVKGGISIWDEFISSSWFESRARLALAMARAFERGRPYKRSHLPKKYSLFGIVGLRPIVFFPFRVFAWISRMIAKLFGFGKKVDSG